MNQLDKNIRSLKRSLDNLESISINHDDDPANHLNDIKQSTKILISDLEKKYQDMHRVGCYLN